MAVGEKMRAVKLKVDGTMGVGWKSGRNISVHRCRPI